MDHVLRLIVVTDTHLALKSAWDTYPFIPRRYHNEYDFDAAEERLARVARYRAEHDADLLVHLGDLSHLGDPESIARAFEIIESGPPGATLVVAGNHDVQHAGDPFGTALRQHEAIGTVDESGCQLESGTWIAGIRLQDVTHATGTPPPGLWGDGFAVILSHFPVLSRRDANQAAGLAYPGDLENLSSIADPLRARPAPTLVLCGHVHTRDVATHGAVLQLDCSAMIEYPFEAALVDIVAGDRDVEVSRYPLPTEPHRDYEVDPVMCASPDRWRWDGTRWDRRPADRQIPDRPRRVAVSGEETDAADPS